jgi:hypothetical protein
MQREISVVGIDIAKRVFPLGGMDARGQIVLGTRGSRGEAHGAAPGNMWEMGGGVCRIGNTACVFSGKARRPGDDASGVSASADDARDWPDRRRCWWQQGAICSCATMAASVPPGEGWCPSSPLQVGTHASWGSASEGRAPCARC